MSNYREHPINRDFTAEAKIDLLRQMLRIRRFEQIALKYYNGGYIGGWLNLSIGQESIAAGARALMGTNDHSIGGSRGIGHAIAAGMEMGPCLAELFGRTNGCSKGKAGMFSFYAPSRNHWVVMASRRRRPHWRRGSPLRSSNGRSPARSYASWAMELATKASITSRSILPDSSTCP